VLTSLQEEKSHLARKADQAMLEAQVSFPCSVCVYIYIYDVFM
jgi:hypothetical protein